MKRILLYVKPIEKYGPGVHFSKTMDFPILCKILPRYDIYLVTVIIKGLRWIQLIVSLGKGSSLLRYWMINLSFTHASTKSKKSKTVDSSHFLGHDIICKSHKYITLITKSQFRMKYEENLAVC